MSRHNNISVNIPDDHWEAIGYNADSAPNCRLLAPTLFINGVGFHLEAGLVEMVDNCATFVDPAMEAEVMPALQALYDGAYELTTIQGRLYVVYGFPFAD